jgi:ribosomal protein S18 acetylase RimI-like enzyme
MLDHATVSTLTTATDKTGATVEIKFCNQTSIGPEELMLFFYKSITDLIDNGHSSSWPSYNSKSMAVFVEVDNKIVGHIMFNYMAEQRYTYIVLSAVDKNYRNRGLYKLMHYEFEKMSKKLGAIQITSFVHVDNATRLITAKSVGLKPQFYKMVKDI